jgi:hypothetical protein
MDVIPPHVVDEYEELKSQWWQGGAVIWTLGELRGIVYPEKRVISRWIAGMVLDPDVKDIVVFAACMRHASMYMDACYKELAALECVTIVCANRERIRTECGTTISVYPINIGQLPKTRGISADRAIIVYTDPAHYTVTTRWFDTVVVPLFQLKEFKAVIMTE